MNASFNYFKNTQNEIFVQLENILFVPFGIDYIHKKVKPVEMETCYSSGAILKFNVPCAVINTSQNKPIRIKDIINLLPDVDILPLSDERFKLKNPKDEFQKSGRVAKKYLDYLVDIYKKNTGEYKGGNIQCNNINKLSEEAFIDIYFDLCCQQIKDAEEEFWNKEIKQEAERCFENNDGKGVFGEYCKVEDWEHELEHGPNGYRRVGLPYPFNDGRVLFEILLPLHSARMSFSTLDLGNTMRRYIPSQSVFDKNLHDGFILDDQELIPKWLLNNNQTNVRKQGNKDRVSFYELDFLFWDGQQFICIELDGNSKGLSEHLAKKENLEKCNNLVLRSLKNDDLQFLINHFNAESSPDLEYRTKTLSNLFSETILKFWETTENDSPIKSLFTNEQWFNEDIGFSKKSLEFLNEKVYPNIPWHLRYSDGFVYFDDPTE